MLGMRRVDPGVFEVRVGFWVTEFGMIGVSTLIFGMVALASERLVIGAKLIAWDSRTQKR